MLWKKNLNLQLQPNEWSCLPTAFAIVLGISLEKVVEDIGHDGSDIIFPDLDEPYRRRSFHIQELIDVCMFRDIGVIPIEHNPESEVKELIYKLQMPAKRLDYYILKYTGVLTGLSSSGSSHAVAWDGEKVLDPNGSIYNISNFHINTFFIITKFNITK